MTPVDSDARSRQRRERDEQIASGPSLPIPELSPDAIPEPLQSHLRRIQRRSVALAGIVENGVVRFLDPAARLPERTRVIIVAENA